MRDPAAMNAAPDDFEPFLTAREVAERLRIAPCTVLRYFDEGVLPGRWLRVGRGRPVRFRWSEIEAALLETRR
jgi:predicted site-specific integrase-resolvase